VRLVGGLVETSPRIRVEEDRVEEDRVEEDKEIPS
jgi:hypothetical protein